MLPSDSPSAGHGANVLILLSAPRSGSTWLGKIFDSHPEVLYRHEPDSLDRGGDLPNPVEAAEIAAWRSAARAYLLRLGASPQLKVAGQLPLFRKGFRSPAAQRRHVATILLLRLLLRVPGAANLAQSWPVSDLRTRPPHLLVIKSVSGCGRAGVFAEALPEARVVFLMREPFGQIASLLHGTRIGKLGVSDTVHRLWAWSGAAGYGLTEAGFTRLSLVEQLAWHWVLANEKAVSDLAGRANVLRVHYGDMRADPLGGGRALFAFAGLDWRDQTERFIRRSTRFGGPESYYQVWRNTAKPETKWSVVLTLDDRARIGAIVQQSSLAHWVADSRIAPATPAASGRPDSGTDQSFHNIPYAANTGEPA